MQTFNRYFRVLPWFMALLLGILVTACGGGSGNNDAPNPVTPTTNGSAALVSIAVTPTTLTLPTSGVQPLTATATYSDGSTRDVTAATSWSSANATTGTVVQTSGVVTGVASGSAVITAAFGDKTATATVTVTSAVLVSVAVTPALATVPINGLQPLVATATYSDGSTLDVSAFAVWTSGSTGVGTVVSTTGVVTGVATGSSLISVNFLGKTSSASVTVSAAVLVSLAVTPAIATVQTGATQALQAKATYSDGSVVDVTTSAAWSSNTTSVAGVVAKTGVVTGVSAGSALVTAVYGGTFAAANVTVPTLTLLSVAVTPSTVTLQPGDSRAFVATGTYSDGSTANLSNTAAWTSGTPAVATVVASTGLAKGISAGSSVITAIVGGKTGSAALTVSAAAGRVAVNLGSAGNFVALAKTGISTTGATAIVGDIGVSPAAASFITGFGLIADASNTFATSSLVTGKVYAANYAPPSPTYMTTAISDMQTAFTDAAGRTLPDATELGAGNISGMTLAPGLYKWGTGVLVTGVGVTLSGGPNAVWIFQIGQDLTISNSAMVTLSGGAQAKNIFWQVSGKATLGTAADFKGNLLSQTLISAATGAVVTGRLLAQTAVTLDAARLTAP